MPPATLATAHFMHRPTPSLQGIPPELRTMIYTHVLHLPVNINPIDGIWLERRPGPWPTDISGSQIAAHALHAQPLKATLPWQQLFLTCKTLSKELQEHLETYSYRSAIENATWTLDIRPDDFHANASIARVWWTKVPCVPHRVRRLVINIGGTSRALILALSLAVSGGFRLNRKQPDPAPAELSELVVNVLSPRPLVFPEHRYGFEPVDREALCKPEFLAVKEALGMYQAGRAMNPQFCCVTIYGTHGEKVELDARGHVR